MPAQPAPTTRTSCFASTPSDASENAVPSVSPARRAASDPRAGRGDRLVGVGREPALEVVAEHAREVARATVVGIGVAPRRARVEQAPLDARHVDGDLEAE